MNQVREYIRGAIGYDRLRGDVVSVTSIQIDRTKQFSEEEAEYWAAIQRRRTVLLVLGVVAVVLVGFILFRIISKEIKKNPDYKSQALVAYKLKFNFKTDAGVLNYLKGKTVELKKSKYF